MQADTAVTASILDRDFAFHQMGRAANVLIFPDLASGNIAYKLVGHLGQREVVGPLLYGLKQPINMVSTSSTVAKIANMAALSSFEVGRS